MKQKKTVKPIASDINFVKEPDSEKYVVLTPKALSEIAEWEEWNHVSDSDIELIVKIKNAGANVPAVYRKAIARSSSGFKNDELMIAYRTKKLLKVDDGDKVSLKKASWFGYLWCNIDSAVRWPFRIAMCMCIGTILEWIICLIKLLM